MKVKLEKAFVAQCGSGVHTPQCNKEVIERHNTKQTRMPDCGGGMRSVACCLVADSNAIRTVMISLRRYTTMLLTRY